MYYNPQVNFISGMDAVNSFNQEKYQILRQQSREMAAGLIIITLLSVEYRILCDLLNLRIGGRRQCPYMLRC
ncbi:hypothetical protein MWN41_00190 [Ornithobacterium rhinotracheale]|uniref:hypothetical protein n=1 Tax=Ornithobacterium rhinotracheale TaxID=28251 RepID=UPI001FF3E75E|nr:hypothetical protein [Ornithobacterium rhinotracheale]MCK0201442.1 hypothetical protein [Ornithobacterium rhinotracheale]